MNNNLETLQNMLSQVEYKSYTIPEEAKEFAKNNNLIIIMGISDDLMHCYGSDSYLTEHKEHNYGWDGDLLINISDKKLEAEAKQLGLEIYWCGAIFSEDGLKIKEINNYDTKAYGFGFSYKVNSNISYRNFPVYENLKTKENKQS